MFKYTVAAYVAFDVGRCFFTIWPVYFLTPVQTAYSYNTVSVHQSQR